MRQIYPRTTVYQLTVPASSFCYSGENIIHHQPYEKICILGDKLYIQGKVTGADLLSLYYKKGSQTNYKNQSIVLSSHLNREFSFEIPVSEISLKGIDYYLKVTNSTYQYCFYKYSKQNPYHLPVVQQNKKEIGPKGGRVELFDGNPFDGATYLDISPYSVNKRKQILIQQVDPKNVPDGTGHILSKKPVCVFNLLPDGLVFNKHVTLSCLYFDLDNDGYVELMDQSSSGVLENNLALFWWDGFEWIYLGGKIDRKKNTLITKIKHFSLYALFPVKKLCKNDFRPKEKILTLNNDGINDIAHFGGSPGDYTIKILDIRGKVIKSIDNSNEWDGRDQDNNFVESGVYLYQFKVKIDNKDQLISGVIVVAK